MVKSTKICVFDKFLSTILGLTHTQTEIQMDNFWPHTDGHTDTRTHRHTDTQLLIFIHIDCISAPATVAAGHKDVTPT